MLRYRERIAAQARIFKALGHPSRLLIADALRSGWITTGPKTKQLERELAEFVGKEDAFLLNYGYQGMVSIIDCLLSPRDVVVYDAEAHACIIDGLRLHKGKRFVYAHNNEESFRLQLRHATELAEESTVVFWSSPRAYSA